MKMSYWLTEKEVEKTKDMYLAGHSVIEIKKVLRLSHTTRAIQKRLKAMGILRNAREKTLTAIMMGRRVYKKKQEAE